MIAIIAAIDRNRAIGLHNQLLFHLSNDLKRFKALTTGHTVVMGRKTFQSLPKGALPHRRNIVLSRQGIACPGAEVYASLEEALGHCDAQEQIYIIGGDSVYHQALPLAHRLCLTEVDAAAPQADAWFPAIDPQVWQETEREVHPADERHPHSYSFVTYERRC